MSIYHNHQHQNEKINRDPRNGHRVRAFENDDRIRAIQSLAYES